jgi:hypothetical protein
MEAPMPLVDFPTHQLFPTMQPSHQFILDRIIEDMLLPVLFAWIVLRVVDWVCQAAQKVGSPKQACL